MKVHPTLRTSDGELLPWVDGKHISHIRRGLVPFPGRPARLGGGSALSRRKWVHLNAAATGDARIRLKTISRDAKITSQSLMRKSNSHSLSAAFQYPTCYCERTDAFDLLDRATVGVDLGF